MLNLDKEQLINLKNSINTRKKQSILTDIKEHGFLDYELLSDVTVIIRGYTIKVFAGFRWDGCSLPSLLWDSVGYPLDFAIESLIHDAIYRTHLLNKKLADKIFHDLLRREGHSELFAKTMYMVVRLGGEDAYEGAVPAIAKNREFVSILPINYKK